jgi:hypothetical protein
MKNIFTVICMTLLLECGKDIPKEWRNINRIICKTENTSDTISVKYLNNLTTILEQLQNDELVSENPKSVKKLISQAYDTSTDCFYAVGKGTINPRFPQEAQYASRKLDAKLNGNNWAFCLKAWNSEKTASRNKPPTGKVFYSKSLYEKIIGDTLYVLFEIPAGSILLSED